MPLLLNFLDDRHVIGDDVCDIHPAGSLSHLGPHECVSDGYDWAGGVWAVLITPE